MIQSEKLLYDATTKFERYQVVDMVYNNRAARVLFSGKRSAAQSGIPKDGNLEMLFDYNQRFLELVESIRPKNILIIGGGAFTLPMEILNNFPDVKVDVIEQDPHLQTIAKRFFGLQTDKRLKIHFDDGREYLRLNSKNYELILIDAFTHNTIPHSLSTYEFVELISERLSKGGVSAVNVISAYHGPNDSVLKQQVATYKSIFKHVDIFPADRILSYWVSQNFLLVSTNRARRPKYRLRFDSLQLPVIHSDDVQHDR